ncbi:MAG TPA: hypothetical protein VFV37_03035, partial [Luteibaculaceae bacterium]|nr:hypothetical protein [Luteibaculaceae bacterium]
MKTTHLKAFFTVGILLIAHQLFAVTKTALLPGAWNNALTWLPLGVPAADDDVVIGNAGNVTVTGSFTCKSLRIGGLLANLTINAGSSLTVDQDVLMQVNAITEGNTFNVLGSLVVKGNLRLEYLVNAATGGSNTLNVGDATNLGSIRIMGDLRLFSSTVASTTKRNTFNFQHGNLFLEKNAVISSNVPTSQVSILNVNDNTTFDNKPKNIFLNGALIGFTVNNYAFLDGNQNAPYAVMYQGTAPQVLAINGLVYQNVIISNSAGVTLEASLPTSALIGNLRVESNGKLDMANFNLNGANRRAGQIFVDNNGVLSLSTATNFPAHLVSGA